MACAFADALLTSATDRSLEAAAGEVARELDLPTHPPIATVIRDEEDEATSLGIRFRVVAQSGESLAGELHGTRGELGCSTREAFRVCTVSSASGARVSAGTRAESRTGLFALAALAAASFAALVAWGLGAVLARRALAPLVRLQGGIAELRLESVPKASPTALEQLGRREGVAEVDALRTAVELLYTRMMDALAHSSRFAVNAAHELRTPLTIVRAELELLAESTLGASEEASEEADGVASTRPAVSLERALQKVRHLQDVTERLLLFASPETQDDARELVSLRDVVEETVLDLTDDERARVTVEPGPDVLVRGDASALGIAISNGVSNALKFGNQVSIDVTGANEIAILSIEDDGPGIAESERRKVFEPFARGHGAHGSPGHGIGLALVAHVAKRHRGEARVAGRRSGRRVRVWRFGCRWRRGELVREAARDA